MAQGQQLQEQPRETPHASPERHSVQTKSLSRVQGAAGGVGVRRTFGILLVLELALDDLGHGATALGCDYILQVTIF